MNYISYLLHYSDPEPKVTDEVRRRFNDLTRDYPHINCKEVLTVIFADRRDLVEIRTTDGSVYFRKNSQPFIEVEKYSRVYVGPDDNNDPDFYVIIFMENGVIIDYDTMKTTAYGILSICSFL